MLARICAIGLLAYQLCCLQVSAATAPSVVAVGNTPLFTSHEVLNLTLSVDFDAMCRPNEVENCQYTPTTMVYTAADGKEHSLPVEIRVRGGWRARKKHCKVPPLFVRFSADATQGTPFTGQGLLPLTTHCRSRKTLGIDAAHGKDYEQYVLREYLGYRLFNAMSRRSLRVRLARINYVNAAVSKRPITRYAFFTEHFDELAARQQTQRLPRKSFDHEKIDLASFDQVAMFNYMIGNTDFSVVRERNILLVADAGGRQYPVPYDLDMSGLVNAEYAGVSPRLHFRDVRKRYYLGFCHPQANFETLFADIQQNKDSMFALVQDTPGMTSSSKRSSRIYLDKFFDILESPKRSQEAIVNACHPWPPAPDDHTTPPDAS